MTCPSAKDIATLLEADLSSVERSNFEMHVERCIECWRLWLDRTAAPPDGVP
jgi:hypothetical protein